MLSIKWGVTAAHESHGQMGQAAAIRLARHLSVMLVEVACMAVCPGPPFGIHTAEAHLVQVAAIDVAFLQKDKRPPAPTPGSRA